MTFPVALREQLADISFSSAYTSLLPVSDMAEQIYFNRFPRFVPDRQATVIDIFKQLAESNGWVEKSWKYKKEKKDYMIAMADTYIGSVERGGEAENLAGLQGLCKELRVSYIPTSITQCKKVYHACSNRLRFPVANPLGQELKKRHVCIIDLIDSRRLRKKIKLFGSQKKLQEHIRTEEHFFPRDGAKEKADGLLTVLLRMIQGEKA